MNIKRIIYCMACLLCMSFIAPFGTSVQFIYPNYFPEPSYDFKKNPLTNEKINLGKALFYDPILSADNSISCASCHSPYNAFAHTDHDLSHGINDRIGKRNAPALINLAWQSNFMWDGAINHLDMQALAPLTHPDEMGENLPSVIQKLKQSRLYKNLFMNAFADSAITGERILKCLSQFQLTLVSDNSKYDNMKSGNAMFTIQEESGYKLFLKKCNSCHTEPLFTNNSFANNGLKPDSTLNDSGRYLINNQSNDLYKFKVPTLRNISYTYPYMHDGRFHSLREVLNHYSSGIQHSETLDKTLQSAIQLSSSEKSDLIAFLLTLNDKSFIFNPKHQFPKEILLSNEGK